jgi:cell division septal protein FtsQ
MLFLWGATLRRQRKQGGAATRHRRAMRVQRSRRVMRLLGLLMMYGVMAFGLYTAYRYVSDTLQTHPKLAIASLAVEGAAEPTERQLRAALMDVIGQNVFMLDLGEIRETVQSHSRVSKAVISTELPNRLRISIVERAPSGLIRMGNSIKVVTDTGEIIGNYSDYGALLDLPVVEGVDGHVDKTGVIQRSLNMLRIIKDESLLFWDNIESLNMSDPENMVVTARNVQAPIFLGSDVIPENITNYLSIAERIENDYDALAYIELGFPNQVAIKPIESIDREE